MEESYKKVSFQEAKHIIDTEPNCVILDVREDTAEEKIPTLDTPILVYCKSGRRSFMAAMKLESYGYTHIYDIGSLVDWPYGLEY